MNIRLNYSLIIGLLLLSCSAKTDKNIQATPESIQHGVIYYEDGKFAGWPANNGIWSWDNEILVGFVVADHKDKTGHTYEPLTARNKYARSKDGGLN
ncbi:MAG: hypothetical protein R2757_22035 [Draconibacterium sp.]